MRMRGHGWLLAAGAAALLPPAGAVRAQDAPYLWAAPGLFGLERSACAAAAENQAEGVATATIDPAFCPLLDIAARERVGARFAEAMAAHFPQVEARFAEGLPPDATVAARLAHTLVASLRLSRAQMWRVDKPVGTDGYLPLTLTLDVTDGATGEVVFSHTRSEIAQGTWAPEAVAGEIAASLPEQLDATMQRLVAEAAATWQPWVQQMRVIGRAEDALIIDGGRDRGLRVGDSIGTDGRVTWVGPDYATVRTVLSRPAIGDVLSRRAASPATSLARPAVLPVIAAAPPGYAIPYLQQIFGEELARGGQYMPVPVNPAFSRLRSLALEEAQAPPAPARSLPDFIATLQVVALPSAAFASNVPGVTIERHEAHAFATLADRSGRIVGAFHGTGRITDEVAGDMRHSAQQRRDTAVRNALNDLADRIGAFRPETGFVELADGGDAPLIADPGGVLPLGAQMPVLRRVSGINGRREVLVPVGDIRTLAAEPAGIRAAHAGLGQGSLRRGDLVPTLRGGPPLRSRRALMRCRGADGALALDTRGGVAMTAWPMAAELGFAGGAGVAVFDGDLPARLAGLGVEFGEWKDFPAATARDPQGCFTPVIGIVPAAAGGYDLTVGYTLFGGGTIAGAKLAGGGLQSLLTPSRMPADAPAEAVSAMLQFDLVEQVLPLALKAAGGLSLGD